MQTCRLLKPRRCVCCLATVVMASAAYYAYLLTMSYDIQPDLQIDFADQAALQSGRGEETGAKATFPMMSMRPRAKQALVSNFSIAPADSSKLVSNFSIAPADSSKLVSNSSISPGSRIPSILHQTWISERIPITYVPFVKSWLLHKPPLSYFYWTDESSLRFVAKHYPNLLATFRSYKAHLSRADAIRYMLLHHYGGVYADMDMLRLKDLTPLLNSSQELCYLSQERYEITRLFWALDSSVMNAIMLSAPGHKFMEYVVKALPRYAHHTPNVMESTGPFFLQNVFNEYQKSPPCNLSSPMCRCAVADPYVFMPQIDPIRIPLFRSKCFNSNRLKANQQEACAMLNKIGWRNDIRSIGGNSYTHHGFLHYGFENQRLKFNGMVDIESIRPDTQIFGLDFH